MHLLMESEMLAIELDRGVDVVDNVSNADGWHKASFLRRADYEIRYRRLISTEIRRCGRFLRGAVRLHILYHSAHGEVHGAWMAQELAHHGYRISPGSLYPTLHKMEAEGLISSRQQVVGGRSRRSYTATAKGRRALTEAKRQLRELAAEILGEEVP